MPSTQHPEGEPPKRAKGKRGKPQTHPKLTRNDIDAKRGKGDCGTPRNPMQHPMLEDVQQRVQYIADLMVKDRWFRSRSRLELMERWGVCEQRIKDYAAEAGRSIDDYLKEMRPSVAEFAFRKLKKVAKIPLALPGDAAAVVRASEVMLKASGYAEPEEDRSRPSTVQVINIGPGQACTSPAMQSLVSAVLTVGTPDGSSSVEGAPAHALPAQGSDDALAERAGSADADAG